MRAREATATPSLDPDRDGPGRCLGAGAQLGRRPGHGRCGHRRHRGPRRQGDRGSLPQAPADARGPADRLVADHGRDRHGRPPDLGLDRRTRNRLLSNDELPGHRDGHRGGEHHPAWRRRGAGPARRRRGRCAACRNSEQHRGRPVGATRKLDPQEPARRRHRGRHAPGHFLLASDGRVHRPSRASRGIEGRQHREAVLLRSVRRDDADDALRGAVRSDRRVRIHALCRGRQRPSRVSSPGMVRPDGVRGAADSRDRDSAGDPEARRRPLTDRVRQATDYRTGDRLQPPSRCKRWKRQA